MAVQHHWLVPPLANAVESRIVQQRDAAQNTDLGDVSVCSDGQLDDDDAAHIGLMRNFVDLPNR